MLYVLNAAHVHICASTMHLSVAVTSVPQHTAILQYLAPEQ